MDEERKDVGMRDRRELRFNEGKKEKRKNERKKLKDEMEKRCRGTKNETKSI